MKTFARPDVVAYVLAALCVLVIGVLGAAGQPIPEILGLLATTAIGGGAGASFATPREPKPEPALGVTTDTGVRA